MHHLPILVFLAAIPVAETRLLNREPNDFIEQPLFQEFLYGLARGPELEALIEQVLEQLRVLSVVSYQGQHDFIFRVLIMVDGVALGICGCLGCRECKVDSHFSQQEPQQLHVLIVDCELQRIPHHSADTLILVPALAPLDIINLKREAADPNDFSETHGSEHGHNGLSLPALHDHHQDLVVGFQLTR